MKTLLTGLGLLTLLFANVSCATKSCCSKSKSCCDKPAAACCAKAGTSECCKLKK